MDRSYLMVPTPHVVLGILSIFVMSLIRVSGQVNPFRCEGFPKDVTRFHYSGEFNKETHKRRIQSVSLTVVVMISHR